MASETRRPWIQRLRRVVTGVPFLVTAGVIVVLAVAYTLAGFLLVPRLITTYVPRYVQEQLKRRAEVGEVRLNPLLFKLEIKHFRLQEADGRPLLGFDRLFVDFELSSLFRRAWTFAEVRLEAPRLDVVMAPDGRLNLADLLDAFPKSEAAPAPEPTAPPRVLLQHALMSGGVVFFTDLSGRAPQTATVEPINVELRNITTLPGRRGPYAISATLTGGGAIDWEGEVSLVPIGSTGRFGLRGLPLATAWRFVQEDVALAEPAGRLDADLRYQFGYREGATSLTVEGIDVTVAALALTQRGTKAPLLAMDRIQLREGRGDFTSRELTIPEISLSRGRLAATMEKDGTLNWQKLVTTPGAAADSAAAGATAKPPAAAPAERPWRVAVEKLRVEEVALSFVDHSRAAPLGVDIAGLSLDLSAKLERGPADLGAIVEGLGVKLAQVAVRAPPAAKTPLVSLDEISLEGGRIDLGGRRVAMSRVGVKGGATTVLRAADGSLPAMKVLSSADQGKPVRPAPAPPARVPTAPPPAAKPWTVALDRFDFAGHRLALTDQSVTPALQLEFDEIKASARDLRSDGKKPFPFDAGFRVKQGGRFTAKGRVAPDGRAADATLALARLAITPAQPYVAQNAAVALQSGEVSTAGRLTYKAGRARPAVTFTGTADIDRLLVVEAATGDPVVAWKALHAETIRFGLAPDRLEVDEVRLGGLDGRFTIFQDKTLNLTRLMKRPDAAPAAPPAGTPPATAPPPGAPTPSTPTPSAPSPSTPAPAGGNDAAAGFPVAIERVRIDDSAMNFADLSLVLPFATRVHGLAGVVAGLGSDPASRATVKLDGRVDEFGLLKVEGALSSLHPKVFTDIAVIFRNVPMSTLTPYSVTFAGRRIVAGTLDLDLQYKIDRSALVGDNKVVLQKVQLGERVESPGAMRLPLDLAIAILSDSQGRIDVALPVRGNVDHPEFSYGHLIWQALVTVITKIVTSPFRALGGLFGGGGDGEGLESIAFDAGSATVLPPEREKLKKVAGVLDKRPQLKLMVHGGYEAKVDGEALRSLRVRQDLARRLEVKLKPGEDPGPVAFDQAKPQRALEAMLAERSGDKAVEEFQAGYEKSTGKKAQRANPMLAFVGRGSPDRAFYEALFRRLVETTPLPDAELAALGRRRGEAAVAALKEGAGAAAPRVEVADVEAAKATRNTVATRLELGAVGAN
jgi:uncharacterized protein involved in outer membrane biogenesis